MMDVTGRDGNAASDQERGQLPNGDYFYNYRGSAGQWRGGVICHLLTADLSDYHELVLDHCLHNSVDQTAAREERADYLILLWAIKARRLFSSADYRSASHHQGWP